MFQSATENNQSCTYHQPVTSLQLSMPRQVLQTVDADKYLPQRAQTRPENCMYLYVAMYL